jgi:hypothetical protein
VKIFLIICCDKLILRSKNIPQKPEAGISVNFKTGSYLSTLKFRPQFFTSKFFSAAFPKKWRPYGHQFFSANSFFLRPVLSYFAEYSGSWQQWKIQSVAYAALLSKRFLKKNVRTLQYIVMDLFRGKLILIKKFKDF